MQVAVLPSGEDEWEYEFFNTKTHVGGTIPTVGGETCEECQEAALRFAVDKYPSTDWSGLAWVPIRPGEFY